MLDLPRFIEKVPLEIDPAEALRFQGRRRGRPQEGLHRLLERQIAHGRSLARPRAVLSVFPSRLLPGGRVRLDDGTVFSIGKAAEDWAGLRYWALAVCTIGEELEGEVSRLFGEGRYSAAVVLDGVGSAAVESLADYVNNLICREALGSGLEPTPRISPGYGDWPLEEQRVIFGLLPADRIGVSLTEKYMMRPRKSVSFGIGIGEGLAVGRGGRCRHCNMAGCPYRAD